MLTWTTSSGKWVIPSRTLPKVRACLEIFCFKSCSVLFKIVVTVLMNKSEAEVRLSLISLIQAPAFPLSPRNARSWICLANRMTVSAFHWMTVELDAALRTQQCFIKSAPTANTPSSPATWMRLVPPASHQCNELALLKYLHHSVQDLDA